MEQHQKPDFSEFVKPTTNGPTPAGTTPPPGDAPAPPADEAPVPAAPLTPMAWLAQNAVYFVAFAAIVGALYWFLDIEGVLRAAMVAIGLGFVVFVHELGHFVAAKWCNVHVQTFSLGFGPALPGCSFRRGETLYKIAVLPLGGYVSMVGEGFEGDEDENYPRSFKNKTVGQRMLIISAGVIMNMILGCVCFVAVFYFHGVDQPRGIVYAVEPASPAWKEGVRSDWRIARIGNKENPNFDDLRLSVASSPWDASLPFVFDPLHGGGGPVAIDLSPRKDPTDDTPVIGVMAAKKLQLQPQPFKKGPETAAVSGSAADRGRVVALLPGDVVVKASADGDDLKPPDGQRFVPWDDFCTWMGNHAGKSITVEVTARVGDKDNPPRSMTLAADGFHFGDRIVGTTKVDQPRNEYDPLLVEALPPDPDDAANDNCDVFEFVRRVKRLAGRPLVVQVRREGQAADAPPVNVLVPTAYTPTTGMVMEMGHVAGVRNNSPADKAKVLVGDTITRIEFGPNNLTLFDASKDDDPVRLPYEMERVAQSLSGPKMVRITVLRRQQNAAEGAGGDPHKGSVEVPLEPVEWDGSWDDNIESPTKLTSPMSIPQLGVAYWVNCTVSRVIPGSPAAAAGILKGDRVAEIAVLAANKTKDDNKEKWSDFEVLDTTRDGRVEHDQWAVYALLSQGMGNRDCPVVKVKVVRNNAPVIGPSGNNEIVLKTAYDPTWPSDNLGLKLMPDLKREKASSIADALRLGLNHTASVTYRIYSGMRSMATGRINAAKGVGGPVAIAGLAYSASEDPFVFLLFMGMISINLAVLNFLPIPVLDGGHMVFLIYEKIRGKPPSDAWRQWLTIGGLALLLMLMVGATFLDVSRWIGFIK